MKKQQIKIQSSKIENKQISRSLSIMDIGSTLMIKHIVIVLSSISLIYAQISFIKTHKFGDLLPITNSIISNLGFTLFYAQNSTHGVITLVCPKSGLPYTFVQDGKIMPVSDGLQFRAMENNRVGVQQSYMYFTSTKILYTSDYFKSNSKSMYNGISNQIILDTIFGSNVDESFNVLSDTGIQCYRFLYNNKTNTVKTSTNKSISTYKYLRMVKNSAHVFLLFREGILIYKADATLTPVQCKPSNTIMIQLKQKKKTYCPNQIIIPVQLKHSGNRGPISQKKKKLENTRVDNVKITQQELITNVSGKTAPKAFKVIFEEDNQQDDGNSFQQFIDAHTEYNTQQRSSDREQSNKKLVSAETVAPKKQVRKMSQGELKILIKSIAANALKTPIEIVDIQE